MGGLDLLPAPRLFATLWRGLCAGYAADAIGLEPAGGRGHDAPTVLAQAEPGPGVGLGQEYRLERSDLTGAALVADQWVAHLPAFPSQPRG